MLTPCFSEDGKSCKQSIKKEETKNVPENNNKIVCGNKLKKVGGISGYEDKQHWCRKSFKNLLKKGHIRITGKRDRRRHRGRKDRRRHKGQNGRGSHKGGHLNKHDHQDKGPFRNGALVTIQSVQFNNAFLRMDYGGCNPGRRSNCATVNAQFGAQGWETFKLKRQPNGTYCIAASENPHVILSFNSDSCTHAMGPGCGSFNAIYVDGDSCSGKEAFTFLKVGDDKWAIHNQVNKNAFMRLDGNSVNAFRGPGSGTVNGQFGHYGWEEYKINVKNQPSSPGHRNHGSHHHRNHGSHRHRNHRGHGSHTHRNGNHPHHQGHNPHPHHGGNHPHHQGHNPHPHHGGNHPHHVHRNQDNGPFRNGALVTIQSVQFNNAFLRMDYGGCNPGRRSNCATVNAQFGAQGWETFKLKRQPNGTYCIAASENPHVILSFNSDSCTHAMGPGCGSFNAIYVDGDSCSGKEAFTFLKVGDDKWAIHNQVNKNAFMRLDGNSVNAFRGPGSGTVNGQFGHYGWEEYKINVNPSHSRPRSHRGHHHRGGRHRRHRRRH